MIIFKHLFSKYVHDYSDNQGKEAIVHGGFLYQKICINGSKSW